MRLLSYAISGLRLYENHECRMDLYAIDAVREPGYTHMLDGAARNISINTAIGVAGINASGKTAALRVTELALDDDTRAALIEAGRNVLAARANHPGQSLADLYDPDYMPTDLRAAHRELDKIADVAFGARKWLKDDDDARLQVLFKSYTRMTGSSEV